jgi:maltose alpha-D-glucosyltransferase/alpha-amylase
MLQAYVVNEGDAWSYTLDQVEQFFERVLEPRDAPEELAIPRGNPLALVDQEPPALVFEIGGYLETARLLGQRSAELHLALASDPEDQAFAPEAFTSLYQRSLYQAIRTGAVRVLDLLRERLPHLPERSASEAGALLERREALLEAIRTIVGERIGGMRIRCHGDFHLGQLLCTGNDFTIIDFEGEPARSLGERRLKRSPLRDIAGMLRSFDYAVHHPLLGGGERGIRDEDVPLLEPWACFWRQWVSSAYLRVYLPAVSEKGLVPAETDELERLLRALLLDKAIYELHYELNNRPDWVRIPIRGILDLLED